MDNLKELNAGFLPGLIRRHTPQAIIENSQKNKKSLKNMLPDHIRNHVVAMSGEFVGTFLFLFFAFSGTQVANTPGTLADPSKTTLPQGPNPAALLYISLAFGFSLAVNAWVFFRVSGGLFNPAVTFALCLIGAVPWVRGGLVFISQVVGAITAAGIVSVLFPGPLAVRTTLGGGASISQGLFIEMFLTAQLVFTIIMLAAEKHKATFIAPVGIGLSLFIAELGGVYYTGGSLNPARSFGPDVILGTFNGYHWIYWLGPALGALLASTFFSFIKAFQYETANPGQDFDDLEAQAFDPERDGAERPVVTQQDRLNSRGSECEDRISRSRDRTSTARNPTATSPSNGNVQTEGGLMHVAKPSTESEATS